MTMMRTASTQMRSRVDVVLVVMRLHQLPADPQQQ